MSIDHSLSIKNSISIRLRIWIWLQTYTPETDSNIRPHKLSHKRLNGKKKVARKRHMPDLSTLEYVLQTKIYINKCIVEAMVI